jgi:hypothetical protein
MADAQVVVTINENAQVDPETFWIHKHQDECVLWVSDKPFTVEFDPHDCPFYEWQFSQDHPCSGLARRAVVTDDRRTYKYTVRVGNAVNDPGGGVQK